MYKQTHNQTQAFRFRRYCRAAYAAFNSLHREVTIGCVATYIADRQLRKSVAVAAVAVVLAHGTAMAQADEERETRTLPEVQVMMAADSLFGTPEPAAVFTAEDLQHSSVRTVGDILALLPAVDVRTRGVGDVQADLSVHGGTFDQMVVMLNGINISDAQTGHHNMDLPVDVSMVERVELLTPSQMMARGVVAFSGGVNIVVCEEYRERLLAEVSGGSYGTANAALLATWRAGQWALTAAGSYHRSDGYMHNTDYRHGSLFLQAHRHAERDDWQLQVGGQMKGFGGAGFYSTTYPDQYEATRTLVASAYNVHRWRTARLETALYGRLHGDRFELFRDGMVDAPAWYTGHNHHIGSTAGVRSRATVQWGRGELLGGVDVRREGIRSNVLGEPDSTLTSPYTKAASRTGLSLFGGYHLAAGRWDAQAVALGLYNTRFGLNYGFAADASYSVGRLMWRVSLSRTFRVPSFTDLYYQSVNQRANAALGAESSLNAEAGVVARGKALSAGLTAYYRSGSDIIDWVRKPDEEVWYSMNHTQVDAVGVDATAAARVGIMTLNAAYSWCRVMQDAGEWISGSALEYLRHKGTLLLAVEPVKGLVLKADATYRYREGRYTDSDGNVCAYGGVLLVGAGAEYTWCRTTIYVRGYNLTDRHYRDHGGVPQPGVTMLAGLRVSIE